MDQALESIYNIFADWAVCDFLEEQEKEGKVFIIRPEAKVEVGRIEKDKAKLTVLYKQGLHDGEKAIEAMKEYLEK